MTYKSRRNSQEDGYKHVEKQWIISKYRSHLPSMIWGDFVCKRWGIAVFLQTQNYFERVASFASKLLPIVSLWKRKILISYTSKQNSCDLCGAIWSFQLYPTRSSTSDLQIQRVRARLKRLWTRLYCTKLVREKTGQYTNNNEVIKADDKPL